MTNTDTTDLEVAHAMECEDEPSHSYRDCAHFASAADEFDLDVIVTALKARGIFAYVEQTGGGCATIYAGPVVNEAEGRYAAAAGPGWFAGPNWTQGRGYKADFCIGVDDDGEAEVTYTDARHTESDVVEMIATVVGRSTTA